MFWLLFLSKTKGFIWKITFNILTYKLLCKLSSSVLPFQLRIRESMECYFFDFNCWNTKESKSSNLARHVFFSLTPQDKQLKRLERWLNGKHRLCHLVTSVLSFIYVKSGFYAALSFNLSFIQFNLFIWQFVWKRIARGLKLLKFILYFGVFFSCPWWF